MDYTQYYKEELQELEDTGRGGTDGALLLRNYIRGLELQVQQEEQRSHRQIEELNNAKYVQEIMQLVTE